MLAEKIPKEQERVKAFRKECGNVKVGEVTVDMVSTLSVSLSIVRCNVYDPEADVMIGQLTHPSPVNRRRDFYQLSDSLNNSLLW